MTDSPFALVHILDAPYSIDKAYTYCLPDGICENVGVGSLVSVPFGGGNKRKTGIVTCLTDKSDYPNVKPVAASFGKEFALDEKMLGLCFFMKENCFCTIGEAVKTIIPPGLAIKHTEKFMVCEMSELPSLNPEADELIAYIASQKEADMVSLRSKFGNGVTKLVSSLIQLGVIEKTQSSKSHINRKNEKYVRSLVSIDEIGEKKEELTKKQSEALSKLASAGTVECSLLSGIGITKNMADTLVSKSLAEYITETVYRSPYNSVDTEDIPDFELSDVQSRAFSHLSKLYDEKRPCAALLFGVTGSGKTNVIEKLADRVFESGRSVIYLVPEIALVSQAVKIFKKRYGENTVIIHSALSAGERADAYARAGCGKPCVVVGTRSAIFAQVHDLGLVVIDEEQDSSYKSEMTPRYHARDIARYRCAKSDAMLLLSSATPSLESFYKAKSGKYELVKLTERYGDAKLPEVVVVDMRNEERTSLSDDGGEILPQTLSERLKAELKESVASDSQSVLFMNRRGYRAFARCENCGYVFECPNCSVSLTYHKRARQDGSGMMLCHYCGYSTPAPEKCPVCGKEHISYMGGGTELVEESLSKLIDKDLVLRMDTDTTGGKLMCDSILEAFRRKEAKVLVGTQMVTKGHDFPSVTLVGVVSADMLLYLNDFRANERAFALLTQVLGRAGRGSAPGRAVIQTYNPEHLTINLAAAQDYEKFYEDEIKLRRSALFPPFCDILTFEFSSENEEELEASVRLFKDMLDKACTESPDAKLILYGPFHAGIYKLVGRYRERFIIKCRFANATKRLFSELYSKLSGVLPKKVACAVDVNPLSL